MNTSIFRNFNIVVEQTNIKTVLERIGNGFYKNEVEECRQYYQVGAKEKYDSEKKLLLGFTPSGVFESGRRIEYLKEYNPLVILDYDKLNPDTFQSIRKKFIDCPYTLTCFVSPSGAGLKVLVKVNSVQQMHEAAYKQVCAHYEKLTDTKIDDSGKDIMRLCFVSYDPDLYMNMNSEAFNVNVVPVNEEKILPVVISKNDSDDIMFGIYQLCKIQNDEKKKYHEGNRNNYIFELACKCNKGGIPGETAWTFMLSDFTDLQQKEIIRTIK